MRASCVQPPCIMRVSHPPITPVRWHARTVSVRRAHLWTVEQKMTDAAVHTTTFDLNEWHHALHQVTGDMALRFNKATTDDLTRWAKMLRDIANGIGAAERPGRKA